MLVVATARPEVDEADEKALLVDVEPVDIARAVAVGTIGEPGDWEGEDDGALIPGNDPVDIGERIDIAETVAVDTVRELGDSEEEDNDVLIPGDEPVETVKGISVDVAVLAAAVVVLELSVCEPKEDDGGLFVPALVVRLGIFGEEPKDGVALATEDSVADEALLVELPRPPEML